MGELEAKLREPLSPGELVRVSQAIRQLTSEREKARAAARAEKAKDAPDPETKHKAAAFVEKMKLMRERHEADAAAAAARGEPLCAVCKGAIGRDTTTAGPRLAQVAAPSAEPETGCRKHNPSGNSLAFYAARSDDEVH